MCGSKKALVHRTSFPVIFVLLTGLSSVYGQEGEKINAKDLFEYHCATCHGTDGKGTKRGLALKAPNFSDPGWQGSKKDAEIVNTIINGKNKMPRWSDKLKSEEIQALAKYIRKFAPKKK